MKAAVYENFQGPISIRKVEDPRPEKNGVVIRLESSGLCLSDWHGWMGHDKDIELPHIPGHELAGIIEEVGKEVKQFKIGDRVTVPFVSGCGSCPTCVSGDPQICDNQFQPGFTHWGSFAQYVSIHYAEQNLVSLPDEIDFQTAASLGCRFATSFRGVVDQGRVAPENWVAVHGCGGVGLSAIMIAIGIGAKVIAIDINKDKLKFAQSIGASHIIDAKENEDVPAEILEITKGGAHLSIDALGNPEILLNSIRSLKKRGRHVQIGIMPPKHTLSHIPIDLIIARELEIYGSHGMQASRYNFMMDMILDGKLDPKKLVSETVKLSDVPSELPSMNTYNSTGIKVITDFT